MSSIISGKLRGRKLFALKKNPIRPTTNRAKEGLFNIISHRWNLKEIRVLDLFSGTGNITYEFASRGVQEIQAIDSNYNCIRYIRNTLEKFQLTKQCKISQENVFTFLKKNPSQAYDIIFADPPYIFSDEKLQYLTNLILYRRNWIKKKVA